MQRLNSILFCLGVALTSGCASGAEIAPTLESPTLQDPTPQEKPSTPAPSQTPRGRSSGAAITFTRSGGIAGISEMWSIYMDGQVVGEAGEVGRIPPEEVSQLLADIEAAGFFEWSLPRQSLESCADCFSYSISVEHQGKTNRITLVDGMSGAPEEAWIILERILQILQSAFD